MTWQDRFYQLLSGSKYGTINELCKEAGIASSTFGNALKGSHVPKPATMEKVAQVLGTTWWYLLNGDEKQSVPDTQVPVLKADQVQSWIDGKLSINDCEELIYSPFPIRNRFFAWRVDVDDMEPYFFMNSYIVFDNEVDYKVIHWHNRLFFLIGWIDYQELGHFGTRDLSELSKFMQEGKKNSDPLPTTSFSSVAVCELSKTMQGFQLMSGDRRFSTAMDPKKHQILAQARYGITAY